MKTVFYDYDDDNNNTLDQAEFRNLFCDQIHCYDDEDEEDEKDEDEKDKDEDKKDDEDKEDDEDKDDSTPSPYPSLGDCNEEMDVFASEEIIDDKGFYCMLNTKMYWDAGYKLFIGHDCDIYNLEITVMMSRDDFENHIDCSTTGAEKQIVKYESIGNGDMAMTFLLTPENNVLALKLDKDAEANVHYDSAWSYANSKH